MPNREGERKKKVNWGGGGTHREIRETDRGREAGRAKISGPSNLTQYKNKNKADRSYSAKHVSVTLGMAEGTEL